MKSGDFFMELFNFNSDRIKRDNFVDEALRDAQLPILHVKMSYNYDRPELENEIMNLIEKN